VNGFGGFNEDCGEETDRNRELDYGSLESGYGFAWFEEDGGARGLHE
jgi:hypothetical protein